MINSENAEESLSIRPGIKGLLEKKTRNMLLSALLTNQTPSPPRELTLTLLMTSLLVTMVTSLQMTMVNSLLITSVLVNSVLVNSVLVNQVTGGLLVN